MIICVCNNVRDRDLRAAAEAGCRSFSDLQRATRVSTCCGRCEALARERFERVLDREPLAVQPA